jgi:membrane protease YdiL (CAAX protease family)
MLSERSWNRELLLLLLAGLLMCWCLGSLLGILLEHLLPVEAAEPKLFYRFVISTLTFHGAALVLVHQLLKLHETNWKEFLGLSRPHLKRAILFALLVAILVLPVILALNVWSARLIQLAFGIKPEPQPTIKVLEASVGLGQRICFGLAALVLAPVAEEVLFRGILYPVLKNRFHPALAAFGTSILFAAFHSSLMTLLPLTVFAVVLVLVYERTDTLLAPILTHALFNAVNFFASIFGTQLETFFHRFFSH